VASIIRSCQIDCKLTEEQLFQSEALGDGAAAGIVEEELAGTGEIAEAEAQTNPPPPMEETKAAVEAHKAEV
jgi:hypothetical protein